MSENDNVIVEVVSKKSIKNRERLEQLAEAASSRENWRFEVVVTNPRKPQFEIISLNSIQSRLSQAQEIFELGMYDSALITVWSATEALLRMLSELEDISGYQNSPLRLVKTLYSEGLLSRSEYELLEKAVQSRNTIAHGYQPEDALDINQIFPEIILLCNRMLRRIDSDDEDVEQEYTPEELVEWFFENYEDPAEGVPYEGGYIYIFGGPYDAGEELHSHFSDANEKVIEKAVEIIEIQGFEWVKKNQY